MSGRERFQEFVARRQVFTKQELIAQGIGRGFVDGAIARGEIVRQHHGILSTPEAEFDPLLDDVIACFATGGVICGRTAGNRHQLTDDLPNQIEILIPHSVTRTPSSRFLRPFRSRQPESFTVGVEERSVLGVPLRMTGRARTVVDLLTGPIRQHGVAALHTFLGEGGTGDELTEVASALGRWDEVEPFVEAALQGMSRTIGR